MKYNFAYILFICLLMGFFGCRPKSDIPGANPKTETEKRELHRIDALISRYYATKLDSAEYYCYRKIEILKSLDRLEPIVETYEFLTRLYQYHQSDSLKTQILNEKLIIVDANTKQAIKYLKYRQSKGEMIANQKNITSYLILLIWLIVGLTALFIVRHRKQINDVNMNLARRTMEIIANETDLFNSHSAPSQNEMNGNLVSQLDHFLRFEKDYLAPDLTLANLAEKLGTDTSYLSQVFNEQHNIGFDDYINDLRIKEACRLLMATNNKNVTIDHILSNSGFSSRPLFYSTFKKFVGVTPDVFKKMTQWEN